jgi:hypothetical protein
MTGTVRKALYHLAGMNPSFFLWVCGSNWAQALEVRTGPLSSDDVIRELCPTGSNNDEV